MRRIKKNLLNALPKNMATYVRGGIIKTMNGIRYYKFIDVFFGTLELTAQYRALRKKIARTN